MGDHPGVLALPEEARASRPGGSASPARSGSGRRRPPRRRTRRTGTARTRSPGSRPPRRCCAIDRVRRCPSARSVVTALNTGRALVLAGGDPVLADHQRAQVAGHRRLRSAHFQVVQPPVRGLARRHAVADRRQPVRHGDLEVVGRLVRRVVVDREPGARRLGLARARSRRRRCAGSRRRRASRCCQRLRLAVVGDLGDEAVAVDQAGGRRDRPARCRLRLCVAGAPSTVTALTVRPARSRLNADRSAVAVARTVVVPVSWSFAGS